MYTITVDREIETAHHNGPESSKCHRNHGHSWAVTVVVYWDEPLDEYGWSVDFHKIKQVIDRFDHNDLNDLLYPLPPSAENLAREVFDDVDVLLRDPDKKAWAASVTVVEGHGNKVTYTR